MQNENSPELDALLDATLDDLADMPEFLKYPAGAHKVIIIGFTQKVVNKHPSFELGMKLVETLELADPTDAPVAPGTETAVLYMMDNEIGQGSFKDVIKPIGAALGTGSMREILEGAKGMEVVVVTKIQPKKDDPEVKYMKIVSLAVA